MAESTSLKLTSVQCVSYICKGETDGSVIIPGVLRNFAKPTMKVETTFFSDLFQHSKPQQKFSFVAICG